MPNHADLLIYAVHAAFWLVFGAARIVASKGSGATASSGEPSTDKEATIRFSRTAIVIHSAAFGVMYFGLGAAVVPDRVPTQFTGQRLLGTIVIAAGAAIASWAVASFRSWRLRAKLDAGHRLVTDGPFRFVRHPIYTGLDLLAIGSAIWVPTGIVWCGALLMIVGSDLRARLEERLLLEAFGDIYRRYCARTRRFIPGIY